MTETPGNNAYAVNRNGISIVSYLTRGVFTSTTDPAARTREANVHHLEGVYNDPGDVKEQIFFYRLRNTGDHITNENREGLIELYKICNELSGTNTPNERYLNSIQFEPDEIYSDQGWIGIVNMNQDEREVKVHFYNISTEDWDPASGQPKQYQLWRVLNLGFNHAFVFNSDDVGWAIEGTNPENDVFQILYL